MEQNFRPEKDGEPSMRPFMLQELANAAMMRDLDPNPNISNLPHPRTLLPEQQPVPNMPQQANQNPLLTLQQQQLILQQLQSGQAPPQPQGQSAVPPSQTGLGFCVDGQPQLASAPQLGQLVGPGQLQFPNPNLRTQGMQTLLSDFQDVSSQLQQLHDLREDKPRQLNQPCGNFPAYNAGSMNPDLGMLQPRMEDDLTLMDGLRGSALKCPIHDWSYQAARRESPTERNLGSALVESLAKESTPTKSYGPHCLVEKEERKAPKTDAQAVWDVQGPRVENRGVLQ
eukprot:g10538.t1